MFYILTLLFSFVLSAEHITAWYNNEDCDGEPYQFVSWPVYSQSFKWLEEQGESWGFTPRWGGHGCFAFDEWRGSVKPLCKQADEVVGLGTWEPKKAWGDARNNRECEGEEDKFSEWKQLSEDMKWQCVNDGNVLLSRNFLCEYEVSDDYAHFAVFFEQSADCGGTADMDYDDLSEEDEMDIKQIKAEYYYKIGECLTVSESELLPITVQIEILEGGVGASYIVWSNDNCEGEHFRKIDYKNVHECARLEGDTEIQRRIIEAIFGIMDTSEDGGSMAFLGTGESEDLWPKYVFPDGSVYMQFSLLVLALVFVFLF